MPTGGAKDTIPPVLVSSVPKNQMVNFNDKKILLEFDEKVTTEKIYKNLIITPLTEVKFKAFTKKNKVTIIFEEPFGDSTTYTLNFFDGITDITEKTPSENLIIAFSTGSYIDSISVFGNVKSLFTNEPAKEYIVGLYSLNDTLSFEKNKPTYFTSTIEDGTYTIKNIKSGVYKIFAMKDENKNLLFEPKTEAYAFMIDTLKLTKSPKDSIMLKSVQLDASTLKMNSARPSGKYFEIRYSKKIKKYDIQSENHPLVPCKIVGEANVLRIYPFPIIGDSTKIIVNITDTLKNERQDTIYVMFKESSKKIEEFEIEILPKSNSPINAETKYLMNFNKPTIITDSNFVNIPIDTLLMYQPPLQNLKFNKERNSISFSFDYSSQFHQQLIDSAKSLYPFDTLSPDSSNIAIQKNLERTNTEKFIINIPKGSFLSVENDTSSTISAKYQYENSEDYGTIKLMVETEKTSYIVELMDDKNIISTQENCTKCIFEKLEAKDYWVRVKHDVNMDTIWTYGNIMKNIEPEPIYFFPELTTLRANWEIEINISF